MSNFNMPEVPFSGQDKFFDSLDKAKQEQQLEAIEHDPYSEFHPFIGRMCDLFTHDNGGEDDDGKPVKGRYLCTPSAVNESGIFFDVLGDNIDDYDIGFEPWLNVRGLYRKK